MPRTQQSSFASGEITPALHSRTDLQQYQNALARAENFFVSVYGGMVNRAGTQFLEEVVEESRLIPFQIGEQQGYVLEFGDNVLRFFTLGARMIVQPNATTINTAIGSASGQWNNRSTGSATLTVGTQTRKIPGSTGTTFGDLTAGAGNAAAFDGDVTQSAGLCANRLAPGGVIGKEWAPSGNFSANRSIVGFRLYGSSDLGFTGRPQPILIHLQASNDGNNFENLGVWSIVDRPGCTFEAFTAIETNNNRVHRVYILGPQSGPPGSGSDIVAISELEFFDRDTGQNSLSLVGSANSVAWASQIVTAGLSGVEHVLSCFVFGGPVEFQVGVGDDDKVLGRRTLNPGWHLVSFSPAMSSFRVQFLHGGTNTRNIEDIRFLNSGGSSPAPLFIPCPYRVDDTLSVTWTQDANVLSLFHDRFPPLELRRGLGPLSWSLTYKRVQPSIDQPQLPDLSLTAFGPAARPTTHTYAVTYITERGEESLPSEPLLGQLGASTLTTTDYMRIQVAQPLPPDVVACNLYKLFGGSYGLMGLFVATFDDIGQAPKVDNPPPQARDPFAGTDNAPVCGAYWEQRFGAGGSVNAPETVELSKPGLPNNFGRSSPPRNDDAITFTPSGPKVRKIKFMLGGVDLIIFTEGAVLVARRGDNALTPALEGGVRQILARGISRVHPLQIDAAVAFVNSDGKSVRLLDAEYNETEVSLLSEHLFKGRTVVDWCYAEAPWSVLWLAMSDGSLVTLSLLLQQGVLGWARSTTAGQVKSLCAIREGGEDVVYWRVRRFLRNGWRNTIERHRSRKITDIENAFFMDCGLSLDNPAPIVALGLTNPATVTLSNAGLVVGDEIDFDGTGIPDIDNHRFRVNVVTGSVYTMGAPSNQALINWSGLGPWLGEGVVRKVFTSVSGLTHLVGHPVMVLNNGDVEGPVTVNGSGSISLNRGGSRVHVGLPYVSECETLDIAESPEGYGRRKRVTKVNLYVRESRGLKIGPPGGTLDWRKPRLLEEWREPNRQLTGVIDLNVQPVWGLGGKIIWRQDQPLPAEVTGIAPLFERGGD